MGTFGRWKPLDIWRLWNRPEAMARKLANNSRGTALMLEMWWRQVWGHRQSGGGLVHSLRLIFIRWVLVFRLVRTNAGRLLCRPGSWWLAEPKATKCYGRLSLSKRVNWVLVLVVGPDKIASLYHVRLDWLPLKIFGSTALSFKKTVSFFVFCFILRTLKSMMSH